MCATWTRWIWPISRLTIATWTPHGSSCDEGCRSLARGNVRASESAANSYTQAASDNDKDGNHSQI